MGHVVAQHSIPYLVTMKDWATSKVLTYKFSNTLEKGVCVGG